MNTVVFQSVHIFPSALLCCRWHTSGGWHSHAASMRSSDLFCLIWCDRDGWLCMMKHCFSVLILQPSASTCRCSSASFSIPLFSFTVPSVRSRLTQKSRTLWRKAWRIPFIDLKPEGSKQGKFASLNFQILSPGNKIEVAMFFFSFCRNLFKLFIFDAVVGV